MIPDTLLTRHNDVLESLHDWFIACYIKNEVWSRDYPQTFIAPPEVFHSQLQMWIKQTVLHCARTHGMSALPYMRLSHAAAHGTIHLVPISLSARPAKVTHALEVAGFVFASNPLSGRQLHSLGWGCFDIPHWTCRTYSGIGCGTFLL